MRGHRVMNRAVLVVVASVGAGAACKPASGDTFTYDFDNPRVTGSAAPGTPLINDTTAGAVGQDNWVLTSGASSVIRNDAQAGFSGNWAVSPLPSANSADGILTRKNNADWGYSLGGNKQLTLTMDVTTGVGAVVGSTTHNRRAEMALGIDLNEDGKLRPTAATNESAEIAFMFGYEATGPGWYVRPAAFGTVITANATPSGTWRAQLVVDLAANSNNGSGTLYIKQLFDGNGNPVNDSYRLAAPTLANVNLGIQRMATVAGGAAAAADPSLWDGMMIRTAGNGGLDNIVISTGPISGPAQWATTGAGNWNQSGNWYPGSVPNGIGAEAELGLIIAAGTSVYTDTPVTLGKLRMNNPASYVLGGACTLTLQTNAGGASVQVQAGTQKINLPLTVASDTTIDVAAGATLKISDPITVQAGKHVTKTGAGTLVYESTVTLEASATLALGGSSAVPALSLAPTSRLDVGKNSLSVASANVAALLAALKAGYDKGEWDGAAGIVSSAAANDPNSATSLGYAASANSIQIKYTWTGDANLDGVVNAADAALVSAAGTTWGTGDFNYDGKVTADDYALFAVGAALGKTNIASVPEPAGLGLLGAATALAVARRARRVGSAS